VIAWRTIPAACLLALAGAWAVLTHSPALAQEAAGGAASLDAARKLVAQGKAAEARPILDQVAKDFPGTPASVEAERIIERIRHLDVLLDISHEWPGGAPGIHLALLEARVGIVPNHAYLVSLRGSLADYELIILWQHVTTVPYDDFEFGTLQEYVKGGGRLLLVSNAPGWMSANRVDSARAYPLIRLAKRFGFKLNKESEELTLGAGKVFHQHFGNDTPLRKCFSAKEEERREGAAYLQSLMPYPKLEDCPRPASIEPEIVLKEGPVTLRYPLTLREGGLWAQKALPQILAGFREAVKSDPPECLLIGVPCAYSYYLPGFHPEYPLLGTETDRAYVLSMTLMQAWLQPPKGTVSYPQWIDTAWPGVVALDTVKKLGIAGRYANGERIGASCLQRLDPNLDKIDISGPVPDPYVNDAATAAFHSKCQHVFRTLMKEHGPGIFSRFRDLVFLYHAAGKLPLPLSSEEAVRLLSIAANKDLFPYFKGLGTRIQSLPIDFSEPEQVKGATPAAAAKP
jgi:hypothetical protein